MDTSFDKYVVHGSTSVIPEPIESLVMGGKHQTVAHNPKTVSVASTNGSTFTNGQITQFKCNFTSGITKNYEVHLAGTFKNTAAQSQKLTSGVVAKIDQLSVWVGGVEVFSGNRELGLFKGLLNEWFKSEQYKKMEGSLYECYDQTVAANGTIDFSIPLADMCSLFAGGELKAFPYTMLTGSAQLEVHVKWVPVGTKSALMGGAADVSDEFSNLRLVFSQVDLSPAMASNLNNLMASGRKIAYPVENYNVQTFDIANGATSLNISTSVGAQYLESATLFFYPAAKARADDTRLYSNPSVSNLKWFRGTECVLGSGIEMLGSADIYRETKKALGQLSSDINVANIDRTTYTRTTPANANTALFMSHISFKAFPELEDKSDSVDNSNNMLINVSATIDAPVALVAYLVLSYKKYLVLSDGTISVYK